MKKLIVLIFSAIILAQEDPFKKGDEAYNQGKLRDALKIYETVAITSSNPSVQADAYIRCALVHFLLNEKLETILSFEKALSLNPDFVPDPAIHNKEFIKLYEIASLRLKLSKPEEFEDVFSKNPVSIPPLFVSESSFSLPLPELKFSTIKDQTPFYIPLDSQAQLQKEDLPSSIPIEGEITIAILLDQEGKPKKGKIYQSDFPQYNNQVLKDFGRWVFTPARKTGQVVSTWASIVLKFSSKYKWNIITKSFLPIEKHEKAPVFIKYNLRKDEIPEELINKIFPDVYNIKDVDDLPTLKKWDFNFEDFNGKELIKGILHISKEGKVLGFRATQIHTPALIPYLEKEFKEKTIFKPGILKGNPVDSFLRVEINANYTLLEPKLLFSKTLKVNLADQ